VLVVRDKQSCFNSVRSGGCNRISTANPAVVVAEVKTAKAMVKEGTLQLYLLRLISMQLLIQQSMKELGTHKAKLEQPLVEEEEEEEEEDAMEGDGGLC